MQNVQDTLQNGNVHMGRGSEVELTEAVTEVLQGHVLPDVKLIFTKFLNQVLAKLPEPRRRRRM